MKDVVRIISGAPKLLGHRLVPEMEVERVMRFRLASRQESLAKLDSSGNQDSSGYRLTTEYVKKKGKSIHLAQSSKDRQVLKRLLDEESQRSSAKALPPEQWQVAELLLYSFVSPTLQSCVPFIRIYIYIYLSIHTYIHIYMVTRLPPLPPTVYGYRPWLALPVWLGGGPPLGCGWRWVG